jgi:hypothetical protein
MIAYTQKQEQWDFSLTTFGQCLRGDCDFKKPLNQVALLDDNLAF